MAGAVGSSAATGFYFCSATSANAERAVRGEVLLGDVPADQGECLSALAGVVFLHQRRARPCRQKHIVVATVGSRADIVTAFPMSLSNGYSTYYWGADNDRGIGFNNVSGAWGGST